MQDAKFNRIVTVIFAVLGAVDVAVGAGFVLGAGYFDVDRTLAWYVGALFIAMGAGMLFFVWRKGAWRSGSG